MNTSIIKNTIISEKTNDQAQKNNQYTFIVDRSATKGAVKNLIGDLFKVKVVAVNFAKKTSKNKRSWVGGRTAYKTQELKKAVVTLDPKDSIKLLTQGAK